MNKILFKPTYSVQLFLNNERKSERNMSYGSLIYICIPYVVINFSRFALKRAYSKFMCYPFCRHY